MLTVASVFFILLLPHKYLMFYLFNAHRLGYDEAKCIEHVQLRIRVL